MFDNFTVDEKLQLYWKQGNKVVTFQLQLKKRPTKKQFHSDGNRIVINEE